MLKSGWGWTENGTYESLIGERVNSGVNIETRETWQVDRPIPAQIGIDTSRRWTGRAIRHLRIATVRAAAAFSIGTRPGEVEALGENRQQ